jgi:cysteinyl-tRNA synthetase
MAIQIYNTLSRKKEEFTTLEPGKVKMYVCGPTVYDFLHVGNFFGAIFFNLVRNWLEKRGYEVKYVYNYTDVDDKIIERAKKEGVDASVISEKYILEFEKDYKRLHLKAHSQNPRVTEFMDEIIEFVADLIAKKKAYELNGDVYFSVPDFKDYGKLSNKTVDDLVAGHRIDVNEKKRHVSDFALWKKAKEGEPFWKSPWGNGRPGWHIECSAMNLAIHGEQIDIHGGGLDLTFPHHENEIAQTEARTGKPFARFWMHNNMLNFGNVKMSKSLGNVRKARDFIEEYNGEVFKFLILSSHYRSIIDFSLPQIERTIANLARFYSSLAFASHLMKGAALVPVPDKFQKALEEATDKIGQALDDDFNTPEVMAQFFEIMRLFNGLCNKPGKVTPEQQAIAQVYFHWLKENASVMALFKEEPVQFLKTLDDMLLAKKNITRESVDALVNERAQARVNKDFAKSDELRKKLAELGIAVQDTATGSQWEVAKTSG